MRGYQNEEAFELPVMVNGEERLLSAKLVQLGYTYKIYVEVEGEQIIFEPDEERNLRAVMEGDTGKNVSVSLVRAIGEALERILR